jgi:hypothetical protein
LALIALLVRSRIIPRSSFANTDAICAIAGRSEWSC